MLDAVSLPIGVQLVRTTAVFTADTVPPGLLRVHRVAPGVWGRLRVIAGEVTFVREDTGEARHMGEGATQVIEPEVEHHVELGVDAAFEVEFHK